MAVEEQQKRKTSTPPPPPPCSSSIFDECICMTDFKFYSWRVPPVEEARGRGPRVVQRMARPHPTLAVADSDRTLILQRRGRCNTNGKRSAYFADSDSSSTCGDPRQPPPPPPDVKAVARTPASAAAAGTASSGGLSRTGGRWILEGIRRSQQGQRRETPTIKDEQDRAPVFYGSVRFPASRVALW